MSLEKNLNGYPEETKKLFQGYHEEFRKYETLKEDLTAKLKRVLLLRHICSQCLRNINNPSVYISTSFYMKYKRAYVQLGKLQSLLIEGIQAEEYQKYNRR